MKSSVVRKIVTLPWNAHMFIEYSDAYRNPKNTEHLWLFFGSGTKLIYLFEFVSLAPHVKKQFLSMLTFPSDPTTCGTFHRFQLVWPRLGELRKSYLLALNPNFSFSLNLNLLFFFFFVFFFFKFQNPQCFQAWRHSRPWSHLPSMCAPN